MTAPYLPPDVLAALSGLSGFGAAPTASRDPIATRGVPPSPSLFASPDPATGLMGVVPDASGMPAAPPPLPPMPKKQSILDRVSMNIRKMIQGDAPAGYNQLLTPEQIDAARPTFFQTLFEGGADPNAFRQNLADAVQGTVVAPMQRRIQAHQQQVMQDIATKFAPDPNATAQENRDRLLQMYTYGEANGADPAWLKELGDVVGKTGTYTDPNTVKKPLVWKESGDKYLGIDPETNKVVATLDHQPTSLEVSNANFQHQMALANLQETKDQHAIQNTDAAVTKFTTSNKLFTDTVPKFMSFENAINQAARGNPAALQTTLYGFVNNTDMNAQMRQGILNKLENVTPGISQKAGFEFEKALNGRLSPQVIASLRAIIEPFHAQLKAQYGKAWDELLKNNPLAATRYSYLSPDVKFDLAGMPAAATAAPGGKVQQYLQP